MQQNAHAYDVPRRSDSTPLHERRIPDKKEDTIRSGGSLPAGEMVGEYKLCEREPQDQDSSGADHLYDVVTSDTIAIQPTEAKPPAMVAAASDINPASPLHPLALSQEKRQADAAAQSSAPGERPTGTEVAQEDQKDNTYDHIADDPAPRPQVVPGPQVQVNPTAKKQVTSASQLQVSPTTQLLAEYAVVNKPKAEPAPPVPPFTTESSILTASDGAKGKKAAEQEPSKATRHHSYINVENKPILDGECEYDVIM